MNNVTRETIEKEIKITRKRLEKVNDKLLTVQAELDALVDISMECRNNELSTIKNMLGLTRIEKDVYRLERHEIIQELLNLNYKLRYNF